MERWAGKTALVTGASSGIGFAITKSLLEAGINVIACSRTTGSLDELKKALPAKSGRLTFIAKDLAEEQQILALFEEIRQQFGHVDILVNNVGTALIGNLTDGQSDAWRKMFDLNIHATTICTREALKLLENDGIERGHIINLNSIAGHSITTSNLGTFYYAATKHMMTALTKALYIELAKKKSRIRVTSLSPGMVATPLLESLQRDPERGRFFSREALECKDIADAVMYILATPQHVTVTELTLMPGLE
ncbi:putative Dehydrogenase/reductase SDR family member 11 [Hypsibius exemplaris]|uniref:Dehydrogenase/reductase SDR family member 11 n=1 Tax=Hypsibius exemplaris TaxID=2072580 RepID=A0A9X6NE71_HYPEX|nr:putative Dehydrogenase/reductase SDR family member 11 [Hypsibius exemplaris]